MKLRTQNFNQQYSEHLLSQTLDRRWIPQKILAKLSPGRVFAAIPKNVDTILWEAEPSQMVKDESDSRVVFLERGAGGRKEGLRQQGPGIEDTLTGIQARDADSWADAEAAGVERDGERC